MRSPWAPLCVVLLAGCREEGPEARIQRAFRDCVRAVEAGDSAGVLAHLSPAFAGPEGMDRGTARLYLAGILAREKVGVTVLGQSLTVDRLQAVQRVEVVLTGRTGGGLLPEEGSRRTFTLVWEFRNGAWCIRECSDATR
jgi:hypothetical protein